jgi:hybrid cluster-associated redox disulfide protein
MEIICMIQKEKNIKGEQKMTEVNKEMTIAEILKIDKAGIAPILMRNGLHCLACPVSTQESLEQACEVHGIELDEILADLNAYLKDK